MSFFNKMIGSALHSKEMDTQEFLLNAATPKESIQAFVEALFHDRFAVMEKLCGYKIPRRGNGFPMVDVYTPIDTSWKNATVKTTKYGYDVCIPTCLCGFMGTPGDYIVFCLPKNKLSAAQIERLDSIVTSKRNANRGRTKKPKLKAALPTPETDAHAAAELLRNKSTGVRKVRQLFDQWWPRRISKVTLGLVDIVFEVERIPEESSASAASEQTRWWQLGGLLGGRTILRFPRGKLTKKQIELAATAVADEHEKQ
ncbi:MAG: hypothetical protein IKO40_11990 [Kiritimatiellae bacterium]|nr:hypothetical protein [Kiritimatiellia bacterium]